jgi:hypothetical protein
VAAHAEGGVHDDGGPAGEGGFEELEDAGQQDGDVPGPSLTVRISVLAVPFVPVGRAGESIHLCHLPRRVVLVVLMVLAVPGTENRLLRA